MIERSRGRAAELAPPLKDCTAARGGFDVALAARFVPAPAACCVPAPAACFVPLDARFMLVRFATTWETHPTARAPSVGAPMLSNVGTEDEKGALRGICVTGGAGHEGEDACRAGASLERVLGDNAGVRAERFEQRGHVFGRA